MVAVNTPFVVCEPDGTQVFPPPQDGYVFPIATAADFPEAVNGVITLDAGKTYSVVTDVDLMGARLVCGADTAIVGTSSENASLRSTGLNAATALITSNHSLPLRTISITHGTALNLDATGNAGQALDWFNVNFIDCANVGTIKTYSNVILQTMGFINCGPLTLDGTVDTVAMAQSIYSVASASSGIVLAPTLTLTRRFRVSYSAFVVAPGATGINASISATIPSEGYILDTVNFAGGGTYTAGVSYASNTVLWSNNRGVTNTSPAAQITMSGNATATTIASINVPVKIAGTTVAGSYNQKFTATNNRLTYSGSLTQTFRVSTIQSFITGNNDQVGVYIAKNGAVIDATETYATANGSGRSENSTTQAIVELAQTDYIEVWIENATAIRNITVTDLNIIVEAIG